MLPAMSAFALVLATKGSQEEFRVYPDGNPIPATDLQGFPSLDSALAARAALNTSGQ